MEWTGQRYADQPTVAVETYIEASPERVWELVSDIHLLPRLSSELLSVEWLDGANGPAVGNAFAGDNRHDAFGEWRTTSYITECEAPRRLTWAVTDPEVPTATWRFTLRPDGTGTLLEQWAQMGPGRSGVSIAIERMPDKEQKIVFVRLRELEAAITVNLAAIKDLAEDRT
ncbi:SRPBCC family protein [Yinghuangia sp. YIM S09857]|uniref:SRPBCC family protein n=1 Tax=Yinghuangia sp. YIM S09857 TaxID=3436929 RepID=UPI003F536AE7